MNIIKIGYSLRELSLTAKYQTFLNLKTLMIEEHRVLFQQNSITATIPCFMLTIFFILLAKPH